MEDYCSQHNLEEELIMKHLGVIANGKYVDIGSGPPVYISNTHWFWKQGWSGLTVDPHPLYAPGFLKERPERNIHLRLAISNHIGKVTMAETLMEDCSCGDVWKEYTDKHPTYEIDCITMDKLIEDHPQFANPDFASIDVEASEHLVLECCNFKIFTPTLIIIEWGIRSRELYKNWQHYLLPYYDLVDATTSPGNHVYLRK